MCEAIGDYRLEDDQTEYESDAEINARNALLIAEAGVQAACGKFDGEIVDLDDASPTEILSLIESLVIFHAALEEQEFTCK